MTHYSSILIFNGENEQLNVNNRTVTENVPSEQTDKQKYKITYTLGRRG